MQKIVLTCVLALIFGFGGAFVSMAAFNSQFQGAQGPTGLTGARGPTGQDGADGSNGVDGKDGKAGKPGKAGERGRRGKPGTPAASAAPQPTDLGSTKCAGTSMSVITDASIDKNQKLVVTRKTVCIVKPAAPTTTR